MRKRWRKINNSKKNKNAETLYCKRFQHEQTIAQIYYDKVTYLLQLYYQTNVSCTKKARLGKARRPTI
jgi:hypothetical protein